jgi:hypothetical protein
MYTTCDYVLDSSAMHDHDYDGASKAATAECACINYSSCLPSSAQRNVPACHIFVCVMMQMDTIEIQYSEQVVSKLNWILLSFARRHFESFPTSITVLKEASPFSQRGSSAVVTQMK